MNKDYYKVGTKLLCIDSDGKDSGIINGKFYISEGVNILGNVNVINDSGRKIGYFLCRFKPLGRKLPNNTRVI
jgi:hypothetical protein